MKRICLSLVFFFVFLTTNEHAALPAPLAYYVIGRFILIETEQGFQAKDSIFCSGYHKRAFNAIKEIL